MLPGRSFNDTSESERNYHLLRISASQSINSITDSVLHDMGVLDSKSAALLQFISVVLAALTFALGLVDATAPYAHYIRVAIVCILRPSPAPPGSICAAFTPWASGVFFSTKA